MTRPGDSVKPGGAPAAGRVGSPGQESPAGRPGTANIEKAVLLFLIISAFYGLATGLSDSVFANYFKEAYDVNAQQRGFIELPRELPGILSFFALAALAQLGGIRTARITMALFFAGMIVLAFVRPEFNVMLAVLFVYSMGMHMFMPLNDSIGISLAVSGNTGRLLGRFKGMTMAFTMVAGVIVFFGFRSGLFSFETPIAVFIISALAVLATIFLFTAMRRAMPPDERTNGARGGVPFLQSLKNNLVVRKEYARYYVICALFGGRKQIMFVYSPWVLIELLNFKTEYMSVLAIIGALIGVFFMPVVGRLIDRYGERKVMIAEALAFIFIYIAYGGLSRWVNVQQNAARLTGAGQGAVLIAGAGMLLVYLLNIVDRMSAQFGMVRSIYMQKIAIKQEDVTPSLTVGMAIDHIMSILGSLVCGTVWYVWGPEYVFAIAGVMSLLNLLVAAGIKTGIAPAPDHP